MDSEEGEQWVNVGPKRKRNVVSEQPFKLQKIEEGSDLQLNIGSIQLQPTFQLRTFQQKKKNKSKSSESTISYGDLQNLILWIFGKGINPPWIFLKDKQYIKAVVVISIGGLNFDLFEKHKNHLPKLLSIFKENYKKIQIPGNDYKVYSPLQSLLELHNKSKNKKKVKKQENKIEASTILHSMKELLDNGFPLAVKSICESKNENGETVMVYTYEPQENFLVFDEIPVIENRSLLAVDCEMCRTKQGLELTRVSVIDENLQVVFDTLVKPDNEIEDYLTQYSGITKELLDPITTTLLDVQRELLKLVSKNTILIGHSLENDLRALKICHFKVLDTSILFPHQQGPPFKLPLRQLVSRYLGRTIQSSSHDSIQDAVAAMELTKLILKFGTSYAAASPTTIFSKLKQNNISFTMIDKPSILKYYLPDGIIAESSDDLVKNLPIAFDSNTQFIYSQVHDLTYNLLPSSLEDIQTSFAKLDDTLDSIFASLPKNTFFVVTSGQADLRELTTLNKQKLTNKDGWTEELENTLRSTVGRARAGVVLIQIK